MSNTEMDVRPAHLGISAGTDRPDAVALRDCRALRHHGRPQMRERHRPAVAGLDRHRSPAPRHGADEADDARCGRTNLLARIAAEVDAAMLICPVRVIRVEQERLNDRSARRPGPRPGGRDADERRQHDTHDDGPPRGLRRPPRPCGWPPCVAAADRRAIATSAQREQEQQGVDRRGHRPANRADRGPTPPGQDDRPRSGRALSRRTPSIRLEPLDGGSIGAGAIRAHPSGAGSRGAGSVGPGPVGGGPVGAGPPGTGPPARGPVRTRPVGAGPVRTGSIWAERSENRRIGDLGLVGGGRVSDRSNGRALPKGRKASVRAIRRCHSCKRVFDHNRQRRRRCQKWLQSCHKELR